MSARHRNGKVQVNIDTRDHRSAHLGIEKLDMIKTDSEGVKLGRGYTCSAMML